MATVYVVRHGESEANREGRYQGRQDSPLSALGHQQAAALAGTLSASRVACVISSPLRRCVETALPVAARLGVPLECDDRVIEIAHGTWEGRLRAEVEREDAARMHAWRTVPQHVRFDGGESLADVDARWRSFAASHLTDADAIVVTHDILVRLAILAATNRTLAQLWEPKAENAAYAIFEINDARWQLVSECCATHLTGLRADISRQAL
jgi:probable phosphoglycerate mutase